MNKLKHLSVGTQVLFTFGTLCAILLIIGGLFFFSLRSIERSNQLQQSRALNKLALIDDTAQDVGQMQAEALRQVLASDIGEIRRLDKSVRDIEQINAKELAVYQKFAETEKEKQLYERVMQARKAYWKQTQPVLALGLANRDAEATELIISKQAPTYDELLKAVNELTKYVEADADETARATTRFISEIRIIGDVLVGVMILIVIGTGFAVAGVGRRLKEDNRFLQIKIIERKQVEESLRLLGSAVEQAKESIVITDAELDLPGPKIIFVNPSFTTMTGYTAAEAIGKTPRILQGPRTDKTVLSRLRKNLEHGEVFAGEAINYRKDGTEFDLEWQIASLRNASGKITHFVAIQHDITERKRTEQESQWKTAFLEAQVNSSIDGILVVDEQGKKTLQNQRFVDLFKIPRHIAEEKIDENQFHWVSDITKDPEQFTKKVRYLYAHPDEISRDEIELKDGTILDRYSSPVVGKDGKYYGRIWTFRDITGRKWFEAQLFQSQKMETVGKLAGGIAHEFNSIMTAIIGQSELLIDDLPPGNPFAKNAAEIRKAAERAAVLTRQLLAYGRKQILQPEILDLKAVIVGMENTLLHLMGRSMEVRYNFAAGVKSVKADAGQIEQVIVNIAMNAADAMPNGGKLTLETANVTLDADYVSRFPELKAGEFVMLAIGDTGAGMSDEVKARVFEPFFTTKGVGKGTGLGLATCHGIVKQSGGHIAVYSELGRGTTFKIYLPQVEQKTELKLPVPPKTSLELPRGTETILLVEDDPSLREMAATLLGRWGYTVLAAANGVEAMGLVHQQGTGHIDLLFTDVVMPQMSGNELADRIGALHPQTKILFASAYTESAIVHQGVLNPGVALLQKPFTPSALAHKVREILDPAKPREN
jgi:two-component system cell cycle sensor histidine kinase/response regulator CckA